MGNKIINGNLEITGQITHDSQPIGSPIEITWSELKALRDAGTLVPGSFYKITDYITTTTTENTQSAGHVFDIIVLALENNKLAEEAWAAHHSGDTYFTNSKLEAWRLWYCLDNDATRFGWADATNGKGVIYRMIDEFDNDIPYDFKNILFTTTTPVAITNAYTFNSSRDEDFSLSEDCYGNTMGKYCMRGQQYLNFNIFKLTGYFCYKNVFGGDCHLNIFQVQNASENTFGSGCYNNDIDGTFSNNIVGPEFANNSIVGGYTMYNIFGPQFKNNTLGNGFRYNIIGSNCTNNMIGEGFTNNTIGTDFSYNLINEGSTEYLDRVYVDRCIFDNGIKYVSLLCSGAGGSNKLQNVHIHSGIKGSSTSNRLVITAPGRNLSYSVDYYVAGSQNININL